MTNEEEVLKQELISTGEKVLIDLEETKTVLEQLYEEIKYHAMNSGAEKLRRAIINILM
jgi:hypothetical protein